MHTLCGWATVRSSELIKVLYQCNPDAAQTVDSAGRTPLDYALHLDNEVAIKALAAGGLVIPPETVQCGEPGVRTLFKMGFGLHLAAQQDIVIPDPPSANASEVSRWLPIRRVRFLLLLLPLLLLTCCGQVVRSVRIQVRRSVFSSVTQNVGWI